MIIDSPYKKDYYLEDYKNIILIIKNISINILVILLVYLKIILNKFRESLFSLKIYKLFLLYFLKQLLI